MTVRLHSTAGDGVLGRQGDLVVLCAAPPGAEGVVDQVVAALDRVSRDGGDGTMLAQSVGTVAQGLDHVAFAPSPQGLAIAVVGHAWAVVATEYGEQRLALPSGHPGVRSVLPGAVRAVRAGLGDVDTDAPVVRWNDLREGTTRAGSLLLAVADDVPVVTTSSVAAAAPAPAAAAAVSSPSDVPPPGLPLPPLPSPDLPPPPPHAVLPDPSEPVQAAPPPPDLEPDAPAFVPPVPPDAPPPVEVPLEAPAVAPAGEFAGAPVPPHAPPVETPTEAPVEAAAEPPAEEPVVAAAEARVDPSPPVAGAHAAPEAPPPGPPEMTAVAAPRVAVDRSQPFASVSLFGAQALEPQQQRAPLPVVTRPSAPPIPDAPIPANPVADDAVEVVGVYCKNGHFDDPRARYCAICGISMAQQTLVPRRGPRPPLGVLVLDDGSIFTLDADYVVGRDPSRDPDVVAGTARPLRIDDPEGLLSRVHVRIHLEGWDVQVVDLGSANGTGIWGPRDSVWQRAPVNTAQTVKPGTQIGVGRRQMRFESHTNT